MKKQKDMLTKLTYITPLKSTEYDSAYNIIPTGRFTAYTNKIMNVNFLLNNIYILVVTLM